jgi:hypothetical protein
VTGSEAPESELGTALIVLGATGVALVTALRSVGRALLEREQKSGCQFTAEERDAILAAASAIPGLEERLATTEVNLSAMIEKLDTLIARSNRTRATDRAR